MPTRARLKTRPLRTAHTNSQVDLSGKTMIVTGANAGLGRVTAEALAKRGATVHLVCRNQERGLAARDEIVAVSKNPNVELHVCDLTSVADTKKLAANFLAKGCHFDVLVNNAGIAWCTCVPGTFDSRTHQVPISHLIWHWTRCARQDHGNDTRRNGGIVGYRH